MPLLLTLACTGTLSNDPFTQDAVFLSALPPAELLQLSYPSDLEEADATLLGMGLSELDRAREMTSNMQSVTQVIQAVSPTERGEHHRVWGPGAWDAVPGAFLRVEMTRTSDGGTYLTTFQTAATSEGPWTEFFEGDASVDPSLAPGQSGEVQGSLHWDAEALNGVAPGHDTQSVRLDYQAIPEGPLALQIISPLDLSFVQQPEGSGSVWLRTRMDIDDAQQGKANIREDVDLLLAWDETGAGRGELLATGGDMPWPEARVEECWSSSGVQQWIWAEPADLGAESGDADLCALAPF